MSQTYHCQKCGICFNHFVGDDTLCPYCYVNEWGCLNYSVVKCKDNNPFSSYMKIAIIDLFNATFTSAVISEPGYFVEWRTEQDSSGIIAKFDNEQKILEYLQGNYWLTETIHLSDIKKHQNVSLANAAFKEIIVHFFDKPSTQSMLPSQEVRLRNGKIFKAHELLVNDIIFDDDKYKKIIGIDKIKW